MERTPNSRQFAWIRWAILLPFLSFGTAVAVMSIPPDTKGIDVASGRDLFRAHCGACHFAKEGFPAHHGPNLHDIGRLGATRQPDLTAADYILESILYPGAFVAPSSRPGMPKNVANDLDPEDIRDIVGFLASCGAYPNYDDIKRLEIPDRRVKQSTPVLVTRDNMELAERALRDKGGCLECHSLNSPPDGHIVAPGLFGAGLSDKKHVYDSIIRPDQEIKPSYGCVAIALINGQIIAGRLLFRGDDHVMVCQRDESGRIAIRNVGIDEIDTEDGQPLIRDIGTSLMPTGLDKSLTTEEVEAVVTLIHQLN